MTLTVLAEAFDRVTVKARFVVPELPSATVALATETLGGVTTVVVCPAAAMAFCHLVRVPESSATMLPVLIEPSGTPLRV